MAFGFYWFADYFNYESQLKIGKKTKILQTFQKLRILFLLHIYST